jgi:CheY-like chemotaxis protein
VNPERPGPVLVVDDDPGSLKLVQATLTPLGYRVVCKADAESGLRAAEDELPNAVILDLSMPQVDGFEFLARFRERTRSARVPVIVWTVKDLTIEEQSRLRASAQAIVLKGRSDTKTLVDELGGLLRSPNKPTSGGERGR